MFITDNNLTLPNFLKALGFLPPDGLTVDQILVDEDAPESVDDTLNGMGFEAKEIDPNYQNVVYTKKDFSNCFSFPDEPNYNSEDNVLAEFPRHIPQSQTGYEVPLTEVPVDSPVEGVEFVENLKTGRIDMKLTEDNILPKGTVLIFREAYESDKEVGNIARAAAVAQLFANDLKTIHWHAVGDRFDQIHNISEVLYDEANDEVDELAELAIRCGEKVSNSSDARSIIDSSEWEIASEDAYDWDAFVAELAERGQKYIAFLSQVEVSSPGDQAIIDDCLRFWQLEINYKNSARGYDMANSEADYRDLLVDDEEENALDDEANELSDETLDMFIDADAKANNYSFDTEDEEEASLEPMTDDMIVTGGEEVDADSFDFDEE